MALSTLRSTAALSGPGQGAVPFAHNAERELASLLDFYGVAWRYEPHTFVLATGADGCATLAFTPDFHLPEFDRYLEVTTLEQRLVTRKNRKVRLLREQVPGIDVQIVYRRDYLALLVKYGLALPEQLPVPRRRGASAGEQLGLLGAPVLSGRAVGRAGRPGSAA